jgi:hypothetical protein
MISTIFLPNLCLLPFKVTIPFNFFSEGITLFDYAIEILEVNSIN